MTRWFPRFAPASPTSPTFAGRSRRHLSNATSPGSPPEHSPALAHEAEKAIPLPGPFHTSEDAQLGPLETPKARKLPEQTGLPTPVLSPLIAFLRFQQAGCGTRKPRCRNLRAASLVSSPFRRTHSRRLRRPPFQPSGFVSPRKHLCNHLQGLPPSRDPHPFPDPFLPCHFAPDSADTHGFEGFPPLERDFTEPKLAKTHALLAFSPLRLSLSSWRTRLPGSSSHVLGYLLIETSCG